jgi:hypothetical protein
MQLTVMASCMTRSLLLYGLAFFPLKNIAQVVQSARVEIPLRRDEQKFEIISGNEHGLFLYRRLPGSPDDQLELARIDTAFTEKWRGYMAIDKRYILMGKRTEKDRLFLLLRYQDYSRNDFTLFSIDQENGNFLRYEIRNFIPFSPLDFQLTSTAALMGGYYNRVPVVIHFSFATQKSKILPGLLNETGDLTQIKTHSDGSFDVLITARNFIGQKTVWIKNYTADGDLVQNLALEPEGNKNLIFARLLKTTNNMQVVAGVFGGRNSEFSRGLFIASVDPSGLQRLRYYNFSDLENFFKYMKARREQRVQERIQRRKIKGKKIRFHYRFIVHELVPHNGQYILLGEAFYPRYTSVDRSGSFFNPYSFSSSSMIRDGRIFDGYYYTHAVVIGFDQQGNILWDNSFEINDVKTYTLEQFVKLEIQHDKVVLLYLYEDALRSKIIKGNEVLEGKATEPIKVNLEDGNPQKEAIRESKLEYWYEDFFYAYGILEIDNPTIGKRRVFYINKISYAK